MMISDGSTLGYHEASFAIPDFYSAPAQDSLRYLTGEPGLDTIRAQVPEGRISLPDLFEKATAKKNPSCGATRDHRVTVPRRFCIWDVWP